MLVKLALPSCIASLREDVLSMYCLITHFNFLCCKVLSFAVRITIVISYFPANTLKLSWFYTMPFSCFFMRFQNEHCELFSLFSYRHNPI